MSRFCTLYCDDARLSTQEQTILWYVFKFDSLASLARNELCLNLFKNVYDLKLFHTIHSIAHHVCFKINVKNFTYINKYSI